MSNRLPPQGIRLTRQHEWWIYLAVALLMTSGLLWLLFHYFVTVHGEFGPARHPLEAWWLKVHGAAAMLALVLIGTMMPVHIRKAWHAGKNRWTGGMMLSVLALLTVTAYALYYFAGEESRPWISLIHWAIGLGLVPVMIVHVINGQLKHGRRTGRVPRHAARPHQSGAAPAFAPRLVSVMPEKSRPADGKSGISEG